MGHKVPFCWLPITTSTNSDTKTLWHHIRPQTPWIIAAGAQTQGRGTQGRVWASPPAGCGVYVTVLLPATLLAADLTPHVTVLAGAIVCNWLAEKVNTLPAGFGIKPVNDVMVGYRKLGGILTESVMTTQGQLDCLIVGVGLNRHTPLLLPPQYPDRAIALDALWLDVTWPDAPTMSQQLGQQLIAELTQGSSTLLTDYHAWVARCQPTLMDTYSRSNK
jgi:biotin-[acetyl-CoA-carboxylase] ligase BirA-like protein